MKFRAQLLRADLGIERLELEAGSEAEARRMLQAQTARLISLRPASPNWWPRRRAHPEFDLAIFNQQLHALLHAGLALVEALETLSHESGEGRQVAVYEVLLKALRAGQQLSAAMEQLPSVFPELLVALIRSGETTGSVKQALQRYIRHHQQVESIRKKLSAALIYPAILLGVGFLVIGFLLLHVIPRFAAVFEGAAITGGAASGFIQAWGGFVNQHRVASLMVFSVLAGWLAIAALHPATRTRAIAAVARFPRLGERLRLFQLARTFRSLGLLLGGGLSLLASMRLLEHSLDADLRLRFVAAEQQIGQGQSLATAFQSCGLGTEMSYRLLRAGESSGNLAEMMEKIADYYELLLGAWLEAASRLIEPILMIGMGLIVGGIVLMLYTPILDLANTL